MNKVSPKREAKEVNIKLVDVEKEVHICQSLVYKGYLCTVGLYAATEGCCYNLTCQIAVLIFLKNNLSSKLLLIKEKH